MTVPLNVAIDRVVELENFKFEVTPLVRSVEDVVRILQLERDLTQHFLSKYIDIYMCGHHVNNDNKSLTSK